jgi:hypothetical protein
VDPKTGFELTKLFQNRAFDEPKVLREAFISFENTERSMIEVKALTPFEAGSWIEKILKGNDPLFQRQEIVTNFKSPVSFHMYVRYRNPSDENKEYVRSHVAFRFHDENSPSEFIFFNQKVPGSPSAKSIINTLKKAGNDWSSVSFDGPSKNNHLTLIK